MTTDKNNEIKLNTELNPLCTKPNIEYFDKTQIDKVQERELPSSFSLTQSKILYKRIINWQHARNSEKRR